MGGDRANGTDILTAIDAWPVDHAAAAIIDADGNVQVHGDNDQRFRLASLSKPMAAYAVLVAMEEGVVDLDDDLKPVIEPTTASTGEISLHSGTTLRHLLAHASGLPFDGPRPIAALEDRRIYSNTGIEAAAAVVEVAAGIPFGTYLTEAVFEPLGMTVTQLVGSPAHGVHSTASDVARFVAEILTPTLLAPSTSDLFVTVQYPDLDGIVPGVGRFTPCPWGLGIEIRGHKQPHWMGDLNAPTAAGHFGGAGTMMWADREARCGLVALTDKPFDQWSIEAMRVWPALSDAVVEQATS